MKFQLLLLCLTSLLSPPLRAEVSDDVAKQKWAEFKRTYHRQYGDPLEDAKFEIFRINLNKIDDLNEHNRKANGHLPFGVTKFSDLAPAEFKNHLLTYRRRSKMDIPTHPLVLEGELPTSVDWRTKGAISAVKDQGQCGSCWAFSVIEELESALFLKTGKSSLLSAQQVNSCSTQNGGCNGGDTGPAFDYLVSRGSELESSYPYTSESGVTGSCKYHSKSVVATMTGYSFAVPSCQSSSDPSCNGQIAQEPLLAAQTAIHPTSVCLVADTWQYYTGGIVAADSSNSDLNSMDHCVQLVGYSLGTQPYWIVRNQWGKGWGEQGYIRLAMGGNTCGIANEVTYVVGASYINGPGPLPIPSPTPSPTCTCSVPSRP